MKYYVSLLIALLIISCKKNDYDNYTVGSEKKMTVTELNASIQGINEDGLNQDEVLINLDGIGNSDVKFTSFRSTFNGYGETEIWDVSMYVINPLFEVAVILKSGERYQTVTPYSFQSGSSIPTSKRTFTIGCKSNGGIYAGIGPNNARTFSELEAIKPHEYDWTTTLLSTLRLGTSGSETEICNFNDATDSVFCDIIINEPTCYPIPANHKTYLVYRKLEDDCFYIGWIELFLSDQNKLEIRKTAISKKPIKF